MNFKQLFLGKAKVVVETWQGKRTKWEWYYVEDCDVTYDLGPWFTHDGYLLASIRHFEYDGRIFLIPPNR